MPQNQAVNNVVTILSTAALSGDTTLTTLAGAPAYPSLLTLTTAGGSGPPSSKIEIVQVRDPGSARRSPSTAPRTAGRQRGGQLGQRLHGGGGKRLRWSWWLDFAS